MSALAELAGLAPATTSQPTNGWLDKWIARKLTPFCAEKQINLRGPEPWQSGRRWVFDVCPWNPDHTNSSAFLVEFPTGAVAAGCQHDGCKDNKWASLKDLVDPIVDLDTAAKKLRAKKDTKSGWLFSTFDSAIEAVALMGHETSFPTIADRRVRLWEKDGYLFAEMQMVKGDPQELTDWTRRTSKWDRSVVELPWEEEAEAGLDTSELIRHVLSPGSSGNIGWCIKINGRWVNENKDNCKSVLMNQFDVSASAATSMLGNDILLAYDLVDYPFQPEYPSATERIWNRFGAQLAFEPKPGPHPHFDMVLNHIGQSLDAGVKQNAWCRNRGCKDGATYLSWWFASVFQNPKQLLPWLFFYGDQNFGKSSLHEMCGMLMTKGYVMVSKAFTRKNGFNAELAGAILAVVEETDLATNLEHAYTLIKELTTSPTVAIELKGWDAYQQRNMAHFIQAGQKALHCPITDPKDSRVVVGEVAELPGEPISANVLREFWQAEAAGFLHYLLHEVKLPPLSKEDDRLYLPVLHTEAKWTVIKGIAKLQNMEEHQRPVAVIAQQVADHVRDLARRSKIVQLSCTDLLDLLTAMGLQDLPQNPSEIGKVLRHIDFRGFTVEHHKNGSARSITILPDLPTSPDVELEAEPDWTGEEIAAEAERFNNLF